MNIYEKNKSKYIDYIKQNQDILAIYLFGSYSDGTYNKDSDIDLGIIYYSEVEEHFEKHLIDSVEVQAIFKNTPIDYIDLEESNLFFRFKVIKNGKKIYCSNEDKLYSYILKNERQYKEMEYDRKKYMEYVLKNREENSNERRKSK